MILYAKEYVEEEILRLADVVNKMDEKPTLALIKVGDDPASKNYVNNKIKMCDKIGIESKIYNLPASITEQELLNLVTHSMNKRKDIDGCLIQLPLPKHINENTVLEALDHNKDVDGFSKENLGKLMRGEDTIVACTPRGVIDLLKHYKIPMSGKNIVIINRSVIVGKPLAMLFMNEDATVSICHSKTDKTTMYDLIYKADIVVTAIGVPKFFKSSDFSSHTTIVDISINRDEYNKLCGDVDKNDYDVIRRNKCNITPVPGGIGQTTVLSLMKNIIEIKEKQNV